MTPQEPQDQCQFNTQNPGGTGFSGQRLGSELDWKSRLRSMWLSAWREVRTSSAVTFRQIRVWAMIVWVEGQRRVCLWRLNRQKLVLGERMYEVGSGDVAIRKQISELDHKIQQSYTNKQPVRQDIVRSRRALLLQLTNSLPEMLDGRVATEAERLQSLRLQIVNFEDARRQQKESPATSRDERSRIGVCLGAFILLFALGLGWSLSGSPNKAIANRGESQAQRARSSGDQTPLKLPEEIEEIEEIAVPIQNPPKPSAEVQAPLKLPDEVVAAWKNAGATVGWLGQDRQYGGWKFTTNRKELDAPPTVQAFQFKEWREGMLAKLPTPAQAFGLDLSYQQVTDAGLKELAGLKQLTTLKLV